MKAPVTGPLLKIYLAHTSTAISSLLAQDDVGGRKYPMYYISRQLNCAETRYPKAELFCLALVYASQELQHYFLAHKLHLIVKIDPIKYFLSKPILSGRLAKWSLQLSEFDITCVTPSGIKRQVMIDMFTSFATQYKHPST